MTTPNTIGAAIVVGLVTAALATSAGLASATPDAIQCGIATSSDRGMLALEGTVLSPVALTGQYRFAIRSSGNGGSSNISQGGGFAAPANQATSLGKMLINAGSNYELTFDVTADGKTFDCTANHSK